MTDEREVERDEDTHEGKLVKHAADTTLLQKVLANTTPTRTPDEQADYEARLARLHAAFKRHKEKQSGN
ncbi:hypothetical protein AUJ14_01595 [Candidatus Micrarchaeota archaeon CG1_02_55_22]|nr:MAG: hypothetical protein AUJ14_01595 [Candidatus Micrarchaeota archaeon CG1_02_55_22]